MIRRSAPAVVRLGLTVLVGCLVVASPALAGEYSEESSTYRGGQNEPNNVRVTFDGGTYTIADTSAPVVLVPPFDGGACTQTNANTVSCPVSAVPRLSFELGNQGDGPDDPNPNSFSFSGQAPPALSFPSRFINVTGGGAADTLSGSPGADDLFGVAGNDRLTGNGGNDLLTAGRGDDVLDGGPGDDSLRNSFHGGCAGNKTITGGPGKDSLYQFCGVLSLHFRDGERDTGECVRPNAFHRLLQLDAFDTLFGSCSPAQAGLPRSNNLVAAGRRGVAVDLGCPYRCVIRATVSVTSAVARRYRLPTVLGQASMTIPKAGRARLQVRLKPAARRRLGAITRLPITVKVTDSGALKTLRQTLRRPR